MSYLSTTFQNAHAWIPSLAQVKGACYSRSQAVDGWMEQNLGTDRNHLSHRVIKWSPVAAAAFASSLFVPPLVSVVIAVSAIALVLFSTKHNFKEMYALSGAICLLGFAVEAFKFAANPGAASIGSVAAPALFAAWSLYCAR